MLMVVMPSLPNYCLAGGCVCGRVEPLHCSGDGAEAGRHPEEVGPFCGGEGGDKSL